MTTLHQVVAFHAMTKQDLATIIVGAISVYATARCIYLLYFHPLCRFPGPRIAAVSNVWYGYHWFSGRYPWAIKNALNKYGEVVRIAPNELVFMNPQAFIDIYSPQQKSLEVFIKTDFNNFGKNLGGIVWEEDPLRHREIAKKVSPAFSNRSIRAMEPLVHKYMDYFIERMKELGGATEGIGLADWMNWLTMDLSADLSWNEEWHQMRDMKNSLVLDVVLGFNTFATVIQVFKRFPLLSPLQYLFAPFTKLKSFAAMEKNTRQGVRRRIDRRGKTDHIDFFEYILPADSPVPTDQSEVTNLGSVGVQIMFAGFGPTSDWIFGTLHFLLEDHECYKRLSEEIRNAFKSYDDIAPGALVALPYLNACLQESLRIFPSNHTGFARISPGATVDGHYVPKGATVQTSIFALARSERYFHDPLQYRPQRWLPTSHPLYDTQFAKDDLKGFFPFSLGPRVCAGKEMAWMQARLFMAKVIWTFDVLKMPGHETDWEGGLRMYGFLIKPQLNVRFVPVRRED